MNHYYAVEAMDLFVHMEVLAVDIDRMRSALYGVELAIAAPRPSEGSLLGATFMGLPVFEAAVPYPTVMLHPRPR